MLCTTNVRVNSWIFSFFHALDRVSVQRESIEILSANALVLLQKHFSWEHICQSGLFGRPTWDYFRDTVYFRLHYRIELYNFVFSHHCIS